jgi:hypothetical protein
MIAIVIISINEMFGLSANFLRGANAPPDGELPDCPNSGKGKFKKSDHPRVRPASKLLAITPIRPGRDRVYAPSCFATARNRSPKRAVLDCVAKLRDKVVLGVLAVVKGRLIRELHDRDGRAPAVLGFCVDGPDQGV